MANAKIDVQDVIDASAEDAGIGFCLACGEREDSNWVEPDARNHRCRSCGQHRVFGCDEILIEMV